MMNSLMSDYHTGKPTSKQFQLCFPTHHNKLVKANENQSIRTKKFNQIFWGKGHLRLLLTQNSLGWSSEDRHGIPKIQHFHRVQYFSLSEPNYVICFEKLDNLNLFSGEWFYRTNFHRATLRDGFSRVTETGVFHLLLNYIKKLLPRNIHK